MMEPYDPAPDDRADESVRKILYRLFGELRSNVAGVLENEDVEFLHDFRVANRRTRTALSQARGVLPSPVIDTFPPEFKWLGTVTGPRRDLDVFLGAMSGHQHRPGTDGSALASLGNFLREKRRLEHDLVRTALQSERFQRLIENWGRFLESGSEGEPGPSFASASTIDVAGPRILKAYRRMRKRGSGIDIEPPAALLHRLRIDGKKLRYLLEFFSDLYPGTTVAQLIRELKQLQEILGDFNDTEVQLALIEEFRDQGSPSAETRTAASDLAEAITERQFQLRSEFAERFESFSSDESRRLYKRTFKVT
jgi:CHAD domain-containing protein